MAHGIDTGNSQNLARDKIDRAVLTRIKANIDTVRSLGHDLWSLQHHSWRLIPQTCEPT